MSKNIIEIFRFIAKRDAEDAVHCMTGRTIGGRDIYVEMIEYSERPPKPDRKR